MNKYWLVVETTDDGIETVFAAFNREDAAQTIYRFKVADHDRDLLMFPQITKPKTYRVVETEERKETDGQAV